MRSGGIPMWNEMAAGRSSSEAAKASLLKGRPVWLITNGRSVNERSRAHCSRSSSLDRTAVPRLPRAPAFETAAASSTWSQGPNGARTMGTSTPSSGHRLVRSMSSRYGQREGAPPARDQEPAAPARHRDPGRGGDPHEGGSGAAVLTTDHPNG